ncbi:Uncharacterised protein [Mycobacteroides abscessus subsp. abscessus]|nr:Uncharacterised protein [Mycobacteroides abscessus subsp. abscessus]
MAMYNMPVICWIITTALASGRTGTTSDSPVDVMVVQLRNSRSIQLRAASGCTRRARTPTPPR